MREQGIVSASLREEERQFEATLRPHRLADFAGQPKVKENLAIAIEAAKQRGEAMDHVLLYGPPGLGKTTLAGIIAAELGVGIQQTSGPVLQKKLDLVGILSNIQEREVFFIDEIHRLLPDVEEMIYSALEDFRMDILIGTGPGRAHRGDGHQAVHRHRRDHAAGSDQRASARPLRTGAAAESLRHGGAGAASCAVRRGCWSADRRRGRGGDRAPQPRDSAHRQPAAAAGARLRAGARRGTYRPGGRADARWICSKWIRFGLDEIDQKIMLTVLEKYGGGPVGLNTIAASIDEEPDTIEEVYEPYLMQLGFLDRTPRGTHGDRARLSNISRCRRRMRGVQNTLF